MTTQGAKITNIDETDITYGIGIREAYRGHDRIYGGGSPERGWVWELSQWEPVVETDGETIRRQIPLVASPSVFQRIEEAEEKRGTDPTHIRTRPRGGIVL